MNMYRRHLELNVKLVLPAIGPSAFIRKASDNTCSTGNVLWPGATAQLFFTPTTFELPSGERHQTKRASANIQFHVRFFFFIRKVPLLKESFSTCCALEEKENMSQTFCRNFKIK